MELIKVSDYVIHEVEKVVDDIFLIPGGGCIHLVDSIHKSNLNPIFNLHEQSASICAESYAQYKNNLGVILVTTGPGSTNALTGVVSAWLDSIPILIIAGQVQMKHSSRGKKLRQFGFQEIDSTKIYNSITKKSIYIQKPEEIPEKIKEAIYLANHGRKGPVLVEIPLDIQGSFINLDICKNYEPKQNKEIIPKGFKDFIQEFYNSKRPIILAGNGIRLSDSIEAFDLLIRNLNIPVLTTWKFADFIDEEDPLFAGRPGAIASRGANFNQQLSDFIIIIGARLDLGQLAYEHKFFCPNAKKVVVEIDESEINKLDFLVDFKFNLNAKTFMNEFLKYSKTHSNKKWLDECKKRYKNYPVIQKNLIY